ncbi:NAD(P)/FAD-dependent oxidoreductase [Ideonella benzenivorans]|uniref:NAD(P)/FAD-dependent oxidoreductase n=1 Tax=Ideonella benzenivorans TaxID=2831643 RepID=UPI002872D5A3|nr:NAD(P)/FAD-dependent oxidoreductase [Ideonella benzenivorans]
MSLPASCDVLVVGAGPAGSACAQMLARAGQQVCLVDQQAFPREKVCGDGLIPDAHAALARLGVAQAVAARAHPVPRVACIGPRGGRVEVPARLAVLPRRELDQILLEAAVAAGADFQAPWRFEGLLSDALGRTQGATLRQGAAVHEISARWVVLATGAVPQALLAAGLCRRRVPSGVAMRGYVRHPAMAARLQAMEVVWHRSLRPGYGWIFPGPDGVFNIGVGIAHSHSTLGDGRGTKQEVNLRAVFEAFCRHHPTARALVDGGEWVGDLKGAPLRFTLEGAHWSAPGVLVTGEAAGSTYSFTGEGIGKALETGMLAADALLSEAADDAVRLRYEASLSALKPRFDLYEKANRINAHPWIADLVIWRAQRSEGLRRRMSGMLEETASPGDLASARGLLKLMLPIR